MTIFDKTTAPSCGIFGITQSRHYTIPLPPPDTADQGQMKLSQEPDVTFETQVPTSKGKVRSLERGLSHP